MLMSHHDVVDGDDEWQTEPFNVVEKDGYLYGRGTIDTKTPLFAELQVCEELLDEGGAITEGQIPGVGFKSAVVAVYEKVGIFSDVPTKLMPRVTVALAVRRAAPC